MKSPRILVIDIETFPNHSRTWPGMFEQNVIKITKNWELASFAYQWLGQKRVHCHTREGQRSDKQLVKKLRDLVDRADILVVQNGKKFDIRSWNARLLYHQIAPPSPFKVVDILLEGRKHFKLNSYSLDNVAEFLGLGRKVKHRGFDMWEECEANDPKAWREMVRYNKRDIVLTGQVYERYKAWMNTHPNLATMAARPDACPRCLAVGQMETRGHLYTRTSKFAKFRCKKCSAWLTQKVGAIAKDKRTKFVNLN